MQWHEVEAQIAVLGRIAAKYPVDSAEEKALRRAAQLLILLESDALRDKWVKRIAETEGDLTPAQKAHLKGMGIEVEEIEREKEKRAKGRSAQ